ncbi:MAG: PorT family protein [Bacteroidales bacterium]|nr:PorT family protein [Bacteroidales bacterium]
MKRILAILTIILFTTSLSFAQKKIDKELWFGAKGGVTFSQLSISPNIKQSMQMGYLGGVSMRYAEERFFGIILELNYAQKGWKEKFIDNDAKYKYSRTLNYIELPFLAHIYFGKKSFRFFVNLGPQIGICVGENTKSNFDLNEIPKFAINRETTHYNMGVDKPFDYGLTGGLGCEIRVKDRHAIMVEGRYYFGLSDIFNNKSADYFSVSSNQSILVSLSYMYNIKGKKR